MRRGSTYAWRKLRLIILERDAYTCQYCGAPADTVDHKVPVHRGGTDEESNLCACCKRCQYDMANRIPVAHGETGLDNEAKGESVFQTGGSVDIALSPFSLPSRVIKADYTAPRTPRNGPGAPKRAR